MRIYIDLFSADCDPGFYPDPSDNSTCIEVPIGTYKTSSGSASFMECPSGFSTVLNGSSDPSFCHSKLLTMENQRFFPFLLYWLTYIWLIIKIKSFIWLCFWFWVIQYLLEICPPGQNPNLTDTTQCIECEIGYFSAVNASDQCEMCSNNFTTPSTGSIAESECKSKF